MSRSTRPTPALVSETLAPLARLPPTFSRYFASYPETFARVCEMPPSIPKTLAAFSTYFATFSE